MTTDGAVTQSYRIAAAHQPGSPGTIQARHSTVLFDSTAGQDPELPGPAELLAAAFAACMLKNVERFAEMMPFHYEHAAIEVTAEREASPPHIARLRYHLRLVTSEPPHRVELLHHNLRKFGTVVNTLAVACEVEGEVSLEPVTGGNAP